MEPVFFYINRTGVRSTKVVYGFPKLSCPTVRLRHSPAWRYIAGGQFGKNLIAFGIYTCILIVGPINFP